MMLNICLLTQNDFWLAPRSAPMGGYNIVAPKKLFMIVKPRRSGTRGFQNPSKPDPARGTDPG